MPNNTDPPEYTSREITHHIVELFKERLNDTTDVGFRCHCGHKGGVQFTDHQAMTSPVAWALPWRQCERILAAWRAHTKDLDDIHPHAEDQIRDFFSRQRQLEQPGGPTMTRYPLTAIPLDTPKPKSIAISTVVDENLRSIIGDYAKKLGIDVDPMGTAEWDVANGPDRPWYASANVATATAMREYLARLLYGDDGLVENLQADEANINEKLDEVVAELRREEAEQPISFPNEVSPPLAPNTAPLEAVEGFADKAHAKVCASTDRPTRIILRSYAADDKPRIERLLGLARQLQIPVQLAGPWSCTAFPPGAEDYLALDVVFPEVLVHPRDVLIISEGHEYHDGNGEKRLFSPSLAEAENQLLWAAREDDQRFVTGLVELLGLPAEASRADIAAAVEAKDDDSEIGVITSHQLAECHRQRARYEECDAQVREILGASQGEESVEAAKRVMADLVEWKRELANWKNDATAQRQENAENLRKLLADINEALGIHSEQSLASVLQRAKWLVEQNKYQTEKLAEILGCKSNDFSALLEKVQRVIREHQTLLGERIESNAKIDQLCASLSRERDRLCRHAESAQNNNAVEQLNAIHVRILHILGPDASTAGIFDSVEKVVKERDNLGEKLDTVHRDLAKRLGLPKDAGWNAIMIAVERIVGDSRNPVEIRANNKELGVKLAREYDRNLHLRAALDTAEKDRDALKERLETVITAERQTIAQRIDLALTGYANCTELESMLRAVEHVKGALSDAEAARRNVIAVLSLNEAAGWGTIASFVAGKRDGLKDCIRRLSLHQSLIGLVADALDAPNEEKDPDDDGDLNTALVDRLTGYYRRLYTAAGFAEPPQGGWAQLLAEFERPRES